ncbi:MAG: putative LPS assembly protein LptD, partial [Bacteroidota bacterium]
MDSLIKAQNSTRPAGDTLPAFNFAQPPKTASPALDSITISPDAVEEQVDYEARDSMYFDLKNKQIHLWGQAKVNYQTMSIEADYIIIDQNENTMSAEGRKDSLGQWIGKPNFKEGEQTFTASRMKYNYKTYKGIIYDAKTQQEGMNVIGEKGKFFGTGGDTTKSNTIYNRNAIFSTCDLDHPHFGIRSNKQKVIPNKVAVVGPCNLIVGDIPTPIWLPFGFFPLKIGRRSGLIFPRDYQYETLHGFGLRGVGWYFPVNEYLDLSLTGDVYLKGTVRMNALTNYRKRYKYSGSANLDFAYERTEDLKGNISRTPSTGIRWQHRQDPKAHPYRTFGGSINLQTNDYQRRNNTDAQSRLATSLSSNMSYSRRFDAPISLNMSMSHSQNTQSKQVKVRLPVVDFQTQAIYPFKKKIPGAKKAWYEDLQFRYNAKALNEFNSTDTTLFTKQTLKDAKFGASHSVSTSTAFTLLKYFNFSPYANYDEVWYFKTVEKEFDPTLKIKYDTIYNPLDSSEFELVPVDTTAFGSVIDNEQFGFKPFRQYDFGMSMNTKIFGTLLFKKGKLRGLRHTLTPTFGFRFSPNYLNPRWGYFKTVTTRTGADTFEEDRYSIFEKNSLGFEQPSESGRQMALTYSFNNVFEAKIFNKRDSVNQFKNVPLLRSLSFSGQYNFAADTLKWSDPRLSTNQSFFNGISTATFSSSFSFYERNPLTGRNIRTFLLDTRGKLLRLTTANFGFDTNISVGRLRDLIKGVNTDERLGNQAAAREDGKAVEEEDFLSLFEDFNIRHNFTVQYAFNSAAKKDSLMVVANSLYTQGNIR